MASSGRHKALEEGKQRIREKVAEIKAQQEAIVQYVAEIVQKPISDADQLMNERNKRVFLHKYIGVMQDLERCLSTIFLVNASLPGDPDNSNDSDSNHDSDSDHQGDDDMGGGNSSQHQQVAAFNHEGGTTQSPSQPAPESTQHRTDTSGTKHSMQSCPTPSTQSSSDDGPLPNAKHSAPSVSHGVQGSSKAKYSTQDSKTLPGDFHCGASSEKNPGASRDRSYGRSIEQKDAFESSQGCESDNANSSAKRLNNRGKSPQETNTSSLHSNIGRHDRDYLSDSSDRHKSFDNKRDIKDQDRAAEQNTSSVPEMNRSPNNQRSPRGLTGSASPRRNFRKETSGWHERQSLPPRFQKQLLDGASADFLLASGQSHPSRISDHDKLTGASRSLASTHNGPDRVLRSGGNAPMLRPLRGHQGNSVRDDQRKSEAHGSPSSGHQYNFPCSQPPSHSDTDDKTKTKETTQANELHTRSLSAGKTGLPDGSVAYKGVERESYKELGGATVHVKPVEAPTTSAEHIRNSPSPAEHIRNSPTTHAEHISNSPTTHAEHKRNSPTTHAEHKRNSPTTAAEHKCNSPTTAAEHKRNSPTTAAEHKCNSPTTPAEHIQSNPTKPVVHFHRSPEASAEHMHNSPTSPTEHNHNNTTTPAEHIHRGPATPVERAHGRSTRILPKVFCSQERGSPVPELQLKEDSTLVVLMTWVHSPWTFWVHAIGNEVDDLYEAITLYLDKKPVYDSVEARVGLVCLSQWKTDNAWYRARVLSIQKTAEGDQLEVLFIDYGNKDSVPAGEVRPLPPQFAKLPSQAIQCAVSEIGPPDGSTVWPPHISSSFGHLLCQKTLQVHIVKINDVVPNKLYLVDLFLQGSQVQPAAQSQLLQLPGVLSCISQKVPNVLYSIGEEFCKSNFAKPVKNSHIVAGVLEEMRDKSKEALSGHKEEDMEALEMKDKHKETKDKTFETKDKSVKTKDKAFETKDKSVKTKDKAFETKDKSVKIKDNSVEVLDRSVENQDESKEKNFPGSHQDAREDKPQEVRKKGRLRRPKRGQVGLPVLQVNHRELSDRAKQLEESDAYVTADSTTSRSSSQGLDDKASGQNERRDKVEEKQQGSLVDLKKSRNVVADSSPDGFLVKKQEKMLVRTATGESSADGPQVDAVSATGCIGNQKVEDAGDPSQSKVPGGESVLEKDKEVAAKEGAIETATRLQSLQEKMVQYGFPKSLPKHCEYKHTFEKWLDSGTEDTATCKCAKEDCVKGCCEKDNEDFDEPSGKTDMDGAERNDEKEPAEMVATEMQESSSGTAHEKGDEVGDNTKIPDTPKSPPAELLESQETTHDNGKVSDRSQKSDTPESSKGELIEGQKNIQRDGEVCDKPKIPDTPEFPGEELVEPKKTTSGDSVVCDRSKIPDSPESSDSYSREEKMTHDNGVICDKPQIPDSPESHSREEKTTHDDQVVSDKSKIPDSPESPDSHSKEEKTTHDNGVICDKSKIPNTPESPRGESLETQKITLVDGVVCEKSKIPDTPEYPDSHARGEKVGSEKDLKESQTGSVSAQANSEHGSAPAKMEVYEGESGKSDKNGGSDSQGKSNSSGLPPELYYGDNSSSDSEYTDCTENSDTCMKREFNLAAREIKVPEDGSMWVLLSHVDSPSRFFVHLVEDGAKECMDKLTEELNDHYAKTNKFVLQKFLEDYEPHVHDICCAKFSGDENVYRAQVLAIKRARKWKVREEGLEQFYTKPPKKNEKFLVHVFYIDFGNTEWLKMSEVYPLAPQYLEIPPQAIPCSLLNVAPIEEHERWSEEAVTTFLELCGGYEKKLAANLLGKGGQVIRLDESPLEVLLLDTSGDFDVWINEELGLSEFACSKSLGPAAPPAGTGDNNSTPGHDEKDEPKTVPPPAAADAEQPPAASDSKDNNQKDEDKDLDPTWNPMAEDFYSHRNSYAVDIDDPGVATVGYKANDGSTICKFYGNGRACWRGEDCPFKHIRFIDGAITQDTVEVYAISDVDSIQLPEEGAWVAVEITAVYNPAHFYVVFPFGSKPLKDIMKEDASTDDGYPESFTTGETLDQMMESMNDYYSKLSHRDRDLTSLALGEIVAAKFSQDNQWYRARVINSNDDEFKVEVFFVDFGNTEWVSEESIFLIQPQFLHLPLQALECFLPLEANSTDGKWSAEAKDYFLQLTDGKVLFAHVLSRGMNGVVCLDLYSTGEEEFFINQSLLQKKFAKPVKVAGLPRGSPRKSGKPVFLPA